MRIALDSSCLVAIACPWHAQHSVTVKEIEGRRRRAATLVIPAHALLEAYSVLTRLPAPHRVAPRTALDVLKANHDNCEIVALTAAEYWDLLTGAPQAGAAGGSIYDALIMACARKARAAVILTWNLEDFARFTDGEPRVSAPGM